MPRLFILLSILTILATQLSPSIIFAQPNSPTTVPSCDLCGWCNPLINPKPADLDKSPPFIKTPHGYWTVFGCLSTEYTGATFVKSILQIIFGMAGGAAFLAILYGSATVLTSSGNPEKVNAGKDIITSSIMGILIIVFAVFILRVVGFDILKIPGFG